MINQEKTLELVDRSQRKDTAAFAQLVTLRFFYQYYFHH